VPAHRHQSDADSAQYPSDIRLSHALKGRPDIVAELTPGDPIDEEESIEVRPASATGQHNSVETISTQVDVGRIYTPELVIVFVFANDDPEMV